MVEVDGPIVLVPDGVIVDDGDLIVEAALIGRAGGERPIADVELHLVAEQPAPAGIEGEDAQRPARRRREPGRIRRIRHMSPQTLAGGQYTAD